MSLTATKPSAAYTRTADGNGLMLPFLFFIFFISNESSAGLFIRFAKAVGGERTGRKWQTQQTCDRKKKNVPKSAHATTDAGRPHRRVESSTRRSPVQTLGGAEHTQTLTALCIQRDTRAHTGASPACPTGSSSWSQITIAWSVCLFPRTNERRREADGPQMIPIMTVALINR